MFTARMGGGYEGGDVIILRQAVKPQTRKNCARWPISRVLSLGG